MNNDTAYTILDWNTIIDTGNSGESRFPSKREIKVNDIKYSIIDYSPGFLADHWCQKGILLLYLRIHSLMSYLMTVHFATFDNKKIISRTFSLL